MILTGANLDYLVKVFRS